MKTSKIFFLFSILVISSLSAQDFDMVDGETVNTDMGNFFDPGGQDDPPEVGTHTYTICPDSNGFFSTISFSDFLLGPNTLTIYDGDSNTAPVLATYTGGIDGANGPASGAILSATDGTPTGCLTYVLEVVVSNPTLPGWEAEIGVQPGCIPDAPELISTSESIINVQNDPVYQADNIDYIVYFNEAFSLTAVAEFQDNFAQETAVYNWDFGDGTTLQGATNASFQNEVTYQYGELCDFTIALNLEDGYNCSRSPLFFNVRVILNPNSSPGSVNLDAGEQVRICEDPGTPVTVNLEATYLDVKESSAYAVENISDQYPSNLPYIFDPCYASDSNVFTELNEDDDWSSVLSLPYEVNFFGNCYSDVMITDNGAVTFDIQGSIPGGRYEPGGFADWDLDIGIPGDGGGDTPPFINAIFGPLQDLFPFASPAGYSINFGFLESEDSKSDRFVFNIYNTSQFGCTDQLQTSQIILYQTTNVIEIYIQNKDECPSWNEGNAIVGIQNQDASIAYAAPGRNAGAGTSWSAQNEAWRFIPDGGNSITTFRWLDENNNVVSTSENFSPQVTQNRVFTAEVTYNDGCNVTTLTDTVEVIYESDIALSFEEDQFFPCAGEELLLEADVVEFNSVVVNYQWFKLESDGSMTPIPDSNSRFLNVDESGTYMINAVGGNCDLNASVEVEYLDAIDPEDPEDILLCDYVETTYDLRNIGGFNSISGFSVAYYDTYDSATQILSDEITDPENYPLDEASGEYDVYVELINDTNTSCTSIASFNISVFDVRIAENGYNLEDVCLAEAATETIDVTNSGANTTNALDGQSISDFSVFYFSNDPLNFPDAIIPDPENYEINANDNLGPNQIWMVVENTNATNCSATASFTFNVNLAPSITGDQTELNSCEGTGVNLEDYNNLFNNNSSSILTSVLYYSSQNDAQNDNPLNDTNITFSPDNSGQQTFYVKILNQNSNCESSIVSFTINNDPPEIANTLDLEQCGDFTQTQIFDLTLNESEVIGSQIGQYSVTYYTTEPDAESGVNSISDQGLDPMAYSPINTTEDIFVRIEDDLNAFCFNVGSFQLLLNEVEVAGVQNLESCIDPVTNQASFNLNQNNTLIYGANQDETTHTINYFDQSNTLITNPANFETNTDTTISVEVVNQNDQSCTATGTFELMIISQPQVSPATALEVCIDYAAGGNNIIDLTEKDSEINALGQGDSVAYYSSEEDYNNDNPIASPNNFSLSQSQDVLFAAVINSASSCRSELTMFDIQNVFPIVDISGFTGSSVCIDENGDLIITETSPPVIETGLSEIDYEFAWSLDGTLLTGETSSAITASQAGVYTVEVTNALAQVVCSASSSAEIIESGQIDFELDIITESFQNNEHAIGVTITEIGLDDYEFRIDYGEWFDLEPGRTSLIFSDVPGGLHTISARGKTGCGEVSKQITLIDYPEFFTPNSDGYNDTWQLNNSTVAELSISEVNIFDRYGKHVFQLSPQSSGWDGTYQGEVLPSDDYWFTIEYVEPLTGEETIFKSHFTLKR